VEQRQRLRQAPVHATPPGRAEPVIGRATQEVVGEVVRGRRQSTPETFASADAPGSARIAASLAVHPYSLDHVLLTYEARTTATDDQARRGVRRYWRVLSPFVGLVLRGVLRAIRRRAETSR
jgi:hypothetical protein